MTLLLLGAITGAVLGLTGAGGSVLAVPLLMGALGWTLPQAAPVALLAVCVAAAFGTVFAWDVTYVRYRAALLMAAAGLLTAPLGLAVARGLPAPLLNGGFALVLVIVAARMALQVRRAPTEAEVVRANVHGDALFARGRWVRLNQRGRIRWDARAFAAIGAIGGATGLVSGLLGVGGGFVIVPALRAASQLSIHSAVSTSLMAIALTSAATTTEAVVLGAHLPWQQGVPFVGGAMAGMGLGRWLAPRIAGPHLQQGFAGLMLLVALGMAGHALDAF